MKTCVHCGNAIDDAVPEAKAQLGVAEARPAESKALLGETKLAAEFDHRGFRLPARTRVGGIIIPQ